MKKFQNKPIEIFYEDDITNLKKIYNRDQKVFTICKCGKIAIRRLRFAEWPLICNKCKMKKTSLEKYGVENISQLESVKEIKKEKWLNKSENEKQEIKNKIKETCLERYNSKTFFGSKIAKKKSEETCLKKYGVKNGGASEQAIKKRKQTIKEKYGVENIYERKDLIQQKFYEKYGVKNPSQLPHIKREFKKSNYIYNGLSFDSSWELAYYIHKSETGYTIIREPIQLKYEFDGEIHYTTPDFEVDGILIEIKGDFMIKNKKWINVWNNKFDKLFQAKQKCLEENNVTILTYKDIKESIEYVKHKYSKNFLKLFKK